MRMLGLSGDVAEATMEAVDEDGGGISGLKVEVEG
jgi:hypothetical protein